MLCLVRKTPSLGTEHDFYTALPKNHFCEADHFVCFSIKKNWFVSFYFSLFWGDGYTLQKLSVEEEKNYINKCSFLVSR